MKSKYWGPFLIGIGMSGAFSMFTQSLLGKEKYIDMINKNNYFDTPIYFPIVLLIFGIGFSLYASRSDTYVD